MAISLSVVGITGGAGAAIGLDTGVLNRLDSAGATVDVANGRLEAIALETGPVRAVATEEMGNEATERTAVNETGDGRETEGGLADD